MLKKPGILLSCGNFHPLHCSGPISKTSSSQLSPRVQQQQQQLQQQQQQQKRFYAVVSDSHSKHHHGQLLWPELTSAKTIPTPYQIFSQKKGSPYSKKRFYELVKLYHPDRHDIETAYCDISYETKLERYRLVVAANDILSDPVKRGAYDTYGAGWNGMPDVTRPRDTSDSSASGDKYNGRGWSGGPRGPSQNATWEDWEKWYQQDSKGSQEPRFVSNGAFVGLIVTFAVLGGIGQATRVGNYSTSFLEQRDALHERISKDLMRSRIESRTVYGSKDERIENFLKQRDLLGYGLADPKNGSHTKLLTAPEICSSGVVKARKSEIYHQKGSPKDD